jgi:hypothetical protein
LSCPFLRVSTRLAAGFVTIDAARERLVPILASLQQIIRRPSESQLAGTRDKRMSVIGMRTDNERSS